jgi:hypothetical protein
MKRSVLARSIVGTALSTLLLVTGALGSAASATVTEGSGPIFDFTDAFYRANGVEPSLLVGRPTGAGGASVVDEAPDADHRDVRMLFTLPAYDTSGHIHYFTVLGDLAPGAFTPNGAGKEARALAEASVVYVFPVVGGDPLGVTNNRQADMVDLSNGYFSNNPLGIWVHVFVNWTPRAFNTAAGRAALAELAAENGLAKDGTPIITSKSDIDALAKAKLVTLKKRPATQTGRYFICPVIEDPRGGSIAPDAFLITVRDDQGNPLPAEEGFVDHFLSLQQTGDWGDGDH